MPRGATISDRLSSLHAARHLLQELPRARLALVLGLMLVAALTEGLGLFLLVPVLGLVSGKAMREGTLSHLAGLTAGQGLATLLAGVVALVAVRAAIQYQRGVLTQKLGMELVDGLRLRCLRLLMGAEWRTLAGMRQSDNASLLLTNVDRIALAFQALVGFLSSGALLLGAGLTALLLSPRLAVALGLAGLVALLAYRRLRRRAVALGELLGTANDTVYARVDESLAALRLVKMLRAEQRAEARVAESVVELRRAELDYLRSFGLGQGALQVSAAAALGLAVWLAVERMGVPGMAVVPLVAVFARTVPLLGAVQEHWQNWLHAIPAIAATMSLKKRLEFAAEPAADPAVAAPLLERDLVLHRVTVRHEGRESPALEGLSLTIPARSTVALTGPSGAGKSTLADLVCGLTAPDEGTVGIDGQVLEGSRRMAWRNAVAYVQQDPVLFHASIRENLCWAAPEADEAALRAALKAASAEFVLDLPEGLDTVVGDRGARLSGGERQRVALARALLGAPHLLVLDEATSALDPANEAAIAQALANLAGRMTIIVICHRGALAALADKVIRLEAGRIAETDQPG